MALVEKYMRLADLVYHIICWKFFTRAISFIFDHWLYLSVTHSLTHSLTNSCLVNLTDVTLACKDANSKLADVVTVDDFQNNR